LEDHLDNKIAEHNGGSARVIPDRRCHLQ